MVLDPVHLLVGNIWQANGVTIDVFILKKVNKSIDTINKRRRIDIRGLEQQGNIKIIHGEIKTVPIATRLLSIFPR